VLFIVVIILLIISNLIDKVEYNNRKDREKLKVCSLPFCKDNKIHYHRNIRYYGETFGSIVGIIIAVCGFLYVVGIVMQALKASV